MTDEGSPPPAGTSRRVLVGGMATGVLATFAAPAQVQQASAASSATVASLPMKQDPKRSIRNRPLSLSSNGRGLPARWIRGPIMAKKATRVLAGWRVGRPSSPAAIPAWAERQPLHVRAREPTLHSAICRPKSRTSRKWSN
jgi:hypothetical protein